MTIRNFIPIERLIAILLIMISLAIPQSVLAQKWSADGNDYYRIENNGIVAYTLPVNKAKKIVSQDQLTPPKAKSPLKFSYFAFSDDQQKLLIFTKTEKVWRLNTRGDYWVLDILTNKLTQLGKTLPSSSLMFAKISPDAKSVAYVSNRNIYVEQLANNEIKMLTNVSKPGIINGTFDWAYEEEFACRDGFRWSPDSKSIAYWQIDASAIKSFSMINNTDAIYSKVIPLEYPKVGENPSSCKLAVVHVEDGKTTWMNIPGDPFQNYIVRMEFIPGTNNLLTQQLNRKQNISKLYISDAASGSSESIYSESDSAWVDLFQIGNTYAIDYTNNFIWVNSNKSILWASEQDGWRHLYQIRLDGKSVKLVTKGDFDVIDLKYTDTLNAWVYFTASPSNATQRYLYRCKLAINQSAELLSPADMKGTHDYDFSTNGKFATHTFSNHFTPKKSEMIFVESQSPIDAKESIVVDPKLNSKKSGTEFFKIITKDGIEMDGWMSKPRQFNHTKKYPVVFYVYTEPAGATVSDAYGCCQNPLYDGDMAEDGYIYISMDNRGTPAPKGRTWRKSIYRKIGKINIRDQAMAAEEVLKWSFVDKTRVAVWGWSGGGSATLNLMFQYPEIYKTGIAIAAVANQLTYDNIYQERYMGLPQDNMDDFVNGSPISHAKNLKGNLLYIHGTGDDNVHYQNAEMLLNELIKHNRQFQFMPYPNRTHSISEGEGTNWHLSSLYTYYLKKNCPPGGL